MPSSDNTILITGATGLVGRALTSRLADAGKKLKLQVRSQSLLMSLLGHKLDPARTEIVECDFTQISTLKMKSLVAGVEQIVHTAGLVHQPGATYSAYDVLNIRTTDQLLEAASEAKTNTFCFLSSSSVYGPGPFEDIGEDGPLKADTPYGVSKVQCESHIKKYVGSSIARLIVLRPSLVFGEGDRGNLLSLIRQISSGKYVNIGGKPTFKSLIYSQDMALVIELCLKSLGNGHFVFNAANPEKPTLKELADTISACLGRKPSPFTVSENLLRAGAKTAQMVLKDRSPVTVSQIDKLTTTTTCSVSKLVEAIKFSPKFALRDAISQEVNWAQTSGLL